MELKFTLTLHFLEDGKVDRESLEANINRLLDKGFEEGIIIPDDDDHATLMMIDLTPA